MLFRTFTVYIKLGHSIYPYMNFKKSQWKKFK